MGGTLNNVHNNVSYALHLHSEAMMKLQEQASTGSRINRPSDGPSTAYRVMGLDSQGRSLSNYVETIEQSSDMMEMGLSVVESMISSVADAKVNLTQIVGGIYGQQGRDRIADGIDDILEQMVSLANTRHMNEYLFGGANSGTLPYSVTRTNGKITGVTYQGSGEDRQVEMAPGVESSALQVGRDIFHLDDRGTPAFFGDTGAAVGTGTASVKGDTWLTVTHDGSNYKLSIDDGASTVTVPSSGDVSNIAVTNGSGEVLYVDATNISSTGVDLVSISGTHDLFGVLITARDVLRNDRGLPENQLDEIRTNVISSLEEVRSHLVDKSVVMGSRIGFMAKLKESVENMKAGTEDEAAMLEEADITQIAIDLSERQLLYQMSLSAAGRIMSMSLLDFI